MKLKIDLQYDFEYKGFVADCPSLPGCMSQGKTRKEALKNIREAIRGYIKVLRKHHQTAPLEVTQPNYVVKNRVDPIFHFSSIEEFNRLRKKSKG